MHCCIAELVCRIVRAALRSCRTLRPGYRNPTGPWMRRRRRRRSRPSRCSACGRRRSLPPSCPSRRPPPSSRSSPSPLSAAAGACWPTSESRHFQSALFNPPGKIILLAAYRCASLSPVANVPALQSAACLDAGSQPTSEAMLMSISD